MVRGFARYLQTVDPATEVPPTDLLPAGNYQPPTPYLYSDADITALMAAARALTPPLRAATFETFIGLLAVTGLRIGEAMRLDRGDVDWANRLLTVRNSKFGRSREVLCHDSTIAALRTYTARRDQLCPHPTSATLFVSSQGTRLTHHSVYPTFHKLVRQVGLRPQPPSRRVRVHDLRHSFAVRTLLRWYSDGGDVQARMPLLSTYMGHVKPTTTYWYYSDSRVIPMPAPSCA
jgi:integrase